MKTMRNLISAAAAACAFSLPAAAWADATTVAPPLPANFANTRTTTDPMAGQFGVTFDGSGRFERVGRAATPYRVALAPQGTQSRPQTRIASSAGDAERTAVDGVVTQLRSQLRSLARGPAR